MYDRDQYRTFWNCCEYFLAHSASGVNLLSFDLIRENYQGKATSDAYIYERLTRPVLAKSARGIKRRVQDYVARGKLGQIEGTVRSLEKSLKSTLLDEITRHLNACLTETLITSVTHEDAPEALLVLASLYHAYYKNKTVTGMAIPPWYSDYFYPLLIKSQKGGPEKVEDWQTTLVQRFLKLWKASGTAGERLTAFFEHKTTRTVISYSFAGVIGFLREEKDKARYLFEVTKQLGASDMVLFQILMSNGLNSALGKEKRFMPPERDKGSSCPVARIGLVSKEQIKAIVDKTVERHFDAALNWCVQYQLSVAGDNPRRKMAKQFDKTFLAMNRHLWNELLILADIQRRVVFRTRHMLRLIVHYLFEIRDVDREFWQKYISSVDNIIHYAYKENQQRLEQLDAILKKQLSAYKKAGKYQGTDWEGFYKDPEACAIANLVIKEINARATSRRDRSIPEVWFSSQVENGVDDQALYRFFKQSVQPA